MSKLLSASTCALLAASLAASAPVNAQSPGYGGVVPGSDNLPETVTAPPGGDHVVTWPGFQMMPDGGSRVFVQTTTELKPVLKRKGDGWVVILADCVLPRGNARLPLVTQYFNSPVTRVRAKQTPPGSVSILIDVRDKVEPKVRTEKAESGYFFVYVEFPPGQYR